MLPGRLLRSLCKLWMLSLSDIYGSRIARAYKCIREHLECIAASVARKLTWYRCRCPDVAKVKPKMIYASSKEELKKRLVGLACEIQGSDQGDVEYDEVVKTIIRLSK